MDYLMLIDKFNTVPADFTDKITFCNVHGALFEAQTGKQLKEMLEAALNDGVKIKIISGYRSFDYQQMLWEKSISYEMNLGLIYENAVKKVSKYLALPGASEHNAGICADLGTENADDTEEYFHHTVQGHWLKENAVKFGFILRYPRMKEHITGIDFEPWHYRYVGTASAELIKSGGLCLEEFLHYYSDDYISKMKFP